MNGVDRVGLDVGSGGAGRLCLPISIDLLHFMPPAVYFPALLRSLDARRLRAVRAGDAPDPAPPPAPLHAPQVSEAGKKEGLVWRFRGERVWVFFRSIF